MDIVLIRTFLEVAETGSFVKASARLFVTQSAVSLRVQRLEDALGKQLFTRSKAGAELTSAGRQFERYARSLIKIWAEANQQVGIPEGYEKSLTIAAQYSLWPRLGFRWIDSLQRAMPTLAVRAEMGMADRITQFLIEGVVQVGLMYNPQLRPGLTLQKAIKDELVLAASWETTLDGISEHYVFVDWGPEFVHAHESQLPGLNDSALTLSLGAMAAEYVVSRRAAAYLPARYIKKYLDEDRLYLVPDAPVFPYPVWSVWRDDLDAEVSVAARSTLVAIIEQIDREKSAVLADLSDISASNTLEVLGDAGDHHLNEKISRHR